MKMLYKVMVSTPVYVYAETPTEAEDLAKKAIIDEREYHWLDYDVYLATLESVPKGFEDYIPWGASFEKMQDANIIEILNYKEDSKC